MYVLGQSPRRRPSLISVWKTFVPLSGKEEGNICHWIGRWNTTPRTALPISLLFIVPRRDIMQILGTETSPHSTTVILEKLLPTVLRLVHDVPISGHPGRDKTMAIAHKWHYWPTLRIDMESHVAECITCSQHKRVVKGPAPILQYPLPEAPWDVPSIGLLHLPQSHHGSQYLLVCVDHITRFVVLAPLKAKTSTVVAHAVVTHLICSFSTPRVILNDNGAEFRNAVVSEICSQFGIR